MDFLTRTVERWSKVAIRRLISNRLTFRGSAPKQDGKFTLLTVDWHATEHACRMIRSFRKFVDPNGRVIVVQNADTKGNALLRREGAEVVGFGINWHHGLGLDYGMRFIDTEYTLICDPDSAIIGTDFREEVLRRIDAAGAASIDNGSVFYHPVCLAFRTELWKNTLFSFVENWAGRDGIPGWDVAGELTQALGGLKDEGLISLTRHAGNPVPSNRAGRVHYFGEVYGDVFTNTYCGSRKVSEKSNDDFEGWARTEIEEFHARWEEWVSAVVEGKSSVEDFPVGDENQVAR